MAQHTWLHLCDPVVVALGGSECVNPAGPLNFLATASIAAPVDLRGLGVVGTLLLLVPVG